MVYVLLFVVYDAELRETVLKNYLEKKDDIEVIYKTINEWVSEIYKVGDLRIPAIFASKVFFGDETWDPSMQTRAVAAIFQLLINCLNLPVWVSWGDLELEEEIIRLIYIFSSASKVEGLKGRVIVCQFSDDDREIELKFKDSSIKIRTLMGGAALIYTLFREFGEGDLNKKLSKAKERFKKIYEKTLEAYKEVSKRKEIVSLEEFEELKVEEPKAPKKEIEDLELDLPPLDEELKELDLDADDIF